MADARLEIRAGSLSFVAEGTERWLADQLDKLLEKLPELTQFSDEDSPGGDDTDEGKTPAPKHGAGAGRQTVTLAAYLKEKKADSQARKFLGAAAWLQKHGGMERMKTGDVTKALHDHKQGKLTNPSQCLSNNEKSGNIVKQGKEFYVPDIGFEALG